MTKCEHQQGDYMTKCEPQHGNIWPSINIKIGTKDQCKYQHSDIGPYVNINTGIYENIWLPAWGYMTKFDYEHRDTWLRENRSTDKMTKCEYQQWFTWSCVDINKGYMTKDIWPRGYMGIHYPVSINAEIPDQIWILIFAHITQWGCQHWYKWPGANIQMCTHD